MNKTIIIREIKKTEVVFLNEMLHQAIYIPAGAEQLSKEIIFQPSFWRYINNFGQKDDVCLVAEVDGVLAGAVWSRIFSDAHKGYGYVNANTPELSLAVDFPYRKMGIGSQLLRAMIEKLTERKYQKVSLSVDKQNFAYQLYQKFGFEDLETSEKSAIMIKKINDE